MWKDPIVEEILAIRRQIERECNHDLGQIVERLRKREKKHQERLIFSMPEKRSETRADG